MNFFIIFIFLNFLFSIPNVKAAPTRELENAKRDSKIEREKLVAFMAMPSPSDEEFIDFVAPNDQKKQMIEVDLGIMYLMHEQWDCEEIAKNFNKDFQRIQCNTFKAYVKYIYEYLFREYARGQYSKLGVDLPENVKPKFMAKSDKETEEESVKAWASIKERKHKNDQWPDLNDPSIRPIHEVLDKTNYLYKNHFHYNELWKPKLKNETKLNDISKKYKQKMEELDKNEWERQQLLENVTQKNGIKMEEEFRANFNKMLEQMAKKAKELAQNEMWQHKQIFGSPFLKKI